MDRLQVSINGRMDKQTALYSYSGKWLCQERSKLQVHYNMIETQELYAD